MLQVILAIGLLVSADNSQDQSQDPTVLERIARVGVNQVLSFVLDAPTTVERVRLNQKEQFLEISNLKIANPKGFEDGDAISVETARLEADPKSLFSDEPLVKLVRVGGVSVNANMDVKRGLNLKKLLDNAKRLQAPGGKKAGGKDSGGGWLADLGAKKSNEKRWRIEKAVFDGGSVNITSPLLLQGAKRKQIDKFEMSFMGEDGKGVTANEALSQVMQTLLDKTGLLEGNGIESVLSPVVDLLKK